MAKEKVKARREEQAALRAAAERKKRQSALLRRVVGGLVLLSVAGGVGYCVVSEREMMAAVTTARYSAGMHIGGKVNYAENPPLGGFHNVAWQNCGIYTSPIHTEHAVHSMEHGAVWITYRPDLPAAEVERLRGLANNDYMLLSPYPGLPAPIVATAWNHQLQLESADDPRLPRFISAFKNNPSNTPEYGALCTGGVSSTAEANTLGTRGVPQMPTGPMR